MLDDDVRLVPMTRAQREHLLGAAGHLFDSELTTLLDMVEAWDAAPSNPAEAIARALILLPKTPEAADAVARSILTVLGVSSPHAANTDTT